MTSLKPIATLAIPFCLGLNAFASATEAPTAIMPENHFGFLNEYCLDCHDAITEEGNVNLEDLNFNLDTLATAELWQKVLNVLNSGEMPPEDETQPDAQAKTDLLDDLSHQLVTARMILSDSGGVITMRRLNRREYENTIEELLGVSIEAEELPKDASTGSFDTVGSALFFSSDQLEQYLNIAKRALKAAITTPLDQEPTKILKESEIATNKTIQKRYDKLLDAKIRGDQWKKSDKSPTEFGFIDAARVKFEEGLYNRDGIGYSHYLSLPQTKTGTVFYATWNGAITDTVTLPDSAPPGKYIIRARVGGFEDTPDHRRFLEVGTVESGARPGELAILDYQKVTGTYENPQIVEFPITVTPSSSRKIGVRERQHNNRDAARFVFFLFTFVAGHVSLERVEGDSALEDRHLLRQQFEETVDLFERIGIARLEIHNVQTGFVGRVGESCKVSNRAPFSR